MKVIIFGATGNVGQHLVHQGLALGYHITTFTRDKSKWKGSPHRNIELRKGCPRS